MWRVALGPRADGSALQIDHRERMQRVVGIWYADGAVCGTRGRTDPEILPAQIQERAIHLSGERQRRTIERVPGRDAVDDECDASPGAAANRTPQ